MFYVTIFLKNNHGKSYSTFNLNLLVLTFVVCFDSLVVVASSSAPEAELITTKCQKKVQIES